MATQKLGCLLGAVRAGLLHTYGPAGCSKSICPLVPETPSGAHSGSWETSFFADKSCVAQDRSTHPLAEITARTPACCRQMCDSQSTVMQRGSTPAALELRASVTKGPLELQSPCKQGECDSQGDKAPSMAHGPAQSRQQFCSASETTCFLFPPPTSLTHQPFQAPKGDFSCQYMNLVSAAGPKSLEVTQA